MAKRNVLFLCTGNYYRSRFAEEYFNYLAKSNALDWRAESRSLADDVAGLRNPGPISEHALSELRKRDIFPENPDRFPQKACHRDFENASCIVAMNRREHQPLLRRNFPEFNGAVEFWEIADVGKEMPQNACDEIASRIDELIDRILHH